MSKTPKLRFKEFSGEWESKKLGDLLIKSSETTNENSDIPVLTSSRKGLFLQTEYFKKEIAAKNTTGYNILRRGYFTYRHMSDDSTFFFNINNILDIALVSPEYPVFTTNDNLNSYILQQHLNSSPLFYKFCKIQKKGGTRTRLYYSVLQEYKLSLPSIEEQEKIASFLSLIDDKISLQGEKVEMLKDYKKGMMQKIFSRELRFKDDEGRDYPEWEEKKLGDIIDKGKAGGTPKSTVKDYYNGNIKFLSISDMTNQGKYITHTEKTITELGLENSSAWLVPKNSLIYSMYASVGFVSITKIELTTSQAMFSMIINKNTSMDYVYHYLSYFKDNGIQAFIETGTQGNLNANTVKNIVIPYPTKDEQNKIASCISSLESRIEKEQEKLDSLNEYKKGLLQQMFV